jgi:hypothetical protein
LRVPIAMPEVYEQNLWIPRNFPPTNPDLHHRLLGEGKLFRLSAHNCSQFERDDRCLMSNFSPKYLYL